MKKKTHLANPKATGEGNGPNAVELKTGEPGNILATRKYVNDAIQEVREQSDKRYWNHDEKLIPDAHPNYQLLPSGLILQWGSVGTPNGGGTWVTFPIAFQEYSYSVFLTDRGGDGCYPGAAVPPPDKLTGFNAWGRSIFNHQLALTGFSWFAIGR